MPQDPNTAAVAVGGFDHADRLEREARALPRWRWWRRRRLLYRARIVREATARFWRDHANDLP